ncbi:hypothetical protein GALL_402440 [mine drainage metagenome]|uniref:Uncharacterized protein n=1 Tax=mine drainage metagenome TaxID=410659 RepID=A0A1J5Q2Y0_9ZZZZ
MSAIVDFANRLWLRVWNLLMRYLETIRRNRQRGDVPGWVLVLLMTAGLVTVMWAIAGPKLTALLTSALDSVSRR